MNRKIRTFVASSILAGAIFLIKQVMALPTGNERMVQIGGAIQEGAKAYLNRQIVTIGAIAAVIFVLLWVFRDHLRANEADRQLYERTKRELAARKWACVQDYADAKTDVVKEILARAA